MAKVKIKTLSPVHIGSGIDLQSDIEYLIDGDRLAIIDEKKVLKVIGEVNIDKWVTIINNRENLFDYLKLRKNDIKLSDIDKRQMEVYCSDLQNKKTLKEQLHNAQGNATIPGSSIKGAIRTAIISYLVEKETERVNNIINKKRSFLNSKGRKWNLGSFQEVESEILNQLLSNSFKPDANHNVFRFLQVTDAYFYYETYASNMQVLNLQRNGWNIKNGSDQLTELIGQDCKSEIRIKINQKLLEENINRKEIKTDISFLNSIEKLFEIINIHTKFLLKKEIDFWKNENNYPESVDYYIENLKKLFEESDKCKKEEALLRIGSGSGWDNITGAWAKTNKDLFSDDEWFQLSKLLNKGRDVDCFPKSRKLDEDGYTLGFIKLSALI